MSDSVDAQLVNRTRAGDQQAYKELVSRYQGHVYGLAYSIVGNWADAQDIAQETFIRAYHNLDQLRDAERFPAWLRRVAFGVAMNWIKSFRPALHQQIDGRIDLDTLEIPDFAPGPAEVTEKRELANAVMRAVASLPAKYRMPLTMFHLDGLSYQKVADFLDIPLGTAKVLIHRARVKLKAALSAYASEEVTPVVQEVFNEHKLPPEFAQKVLENVPTLAFGRGKDCTFVGAVEAATAVTEHPCRYSDLMGWSGLAFRTRWWRWTNEPKWCPSCAVGEFPNETHRIQEASGWQFRHIVHFGAPLQEQQASEVMASINSGKPVIGYDDCWDVSLAYGYQESGKVFLWRNYHKGQTPHVVPSNKLVGWWMVLDRWIEPPSSLEALKLALRTAVEQWRLERGDGGLAGRDYWYGHAAFKAWIKDLALAETLDEKKRQELFHPSRFNYFTLIDARSSAVTFLREHASLLSGEGKAALERAADLYAHELEHLGADKGEWRWPKNHAEWFSQVRPSQHKLLGDALQTEAAVVAQLAAALSAME